MSKAAKTLIEEFRKARDSQAIRPSASAAVAWGNQLADAYELLTATLTRERDALEAANRLADRWGRESLARPTLAIPVRRAVKELRAALDASSGGHFQHRCKR